MKINFRKVIFSLSVLGIASYIYAAARGSGSYTPRSIGSPAEQLYLVISREDPGYLTDLSTNSVDRNFIIISSAVYRLETLAGNTNYIQLRVTLQSGSTAYISSFSVDGQTLLARNSGSVGIGLNAAPTTRGLQVANDFATGGVFYSTGNIIFGSGAQMSTYTASSESLEIGGNLTAAGSFSSSGPVILGDNSNDIITSNSSSFTFVNGSTVSFPIGSQINFTEANSCSKFTISTGAAYALLVASAPTGAAQSNSTSFAAITPPMVPGATKPKMVLLDVLCDMSADATAELDVATLRLSTSATMSTNPSSACRAATALASERSFNDKQRWFPLTSGQFFYHCAFSQATTTTNGSECDIYLIGMCE